MDRWMGGWIDPLDGWMNRGINDKQRDRWID